MIVEQLHKTVTHWGDWHVFAVCEVCFWEGRRTNEHHAGRTQREDEARHTRDMHRKYRRARRWVWLTRRRPTIHLVARRSGRPLRCCGKKPTEVHGLDRFTFEDSEHTCTAGPAA